MEKLTVQQIADLATSQARYKEIITAIREELKELAQQQKQLKTEGNRSSVMYGRYRITALHNVYLELRGKLYRHANQQYWNCWTYRYAFERLKKKYSIGE